ncbi:MAG: hypothetical protein ACR2GS_06155 [Thermomicrobiales bacterium]|jgi:hypothetical protein
MTSSERGSHQLRIWVHPEPDAEMVAVIFAAVSAVRRPEQSVNVDGAGDYLSSQWARAGRREAMSGRGEDQERHGSW